MAAESRLVVAAAILFAVSTPAGAQQRTASVAPPVQMGMARSTPIVHSRPVGSHVVAPHVAGAPAAPRRITTSAPAAPRPAVHFNPSTNSFQTADGSFVGLQDLLNPVPGLGFDYSHLSAINQDLLIKAAIDPATQLKIAEAQRLLRGTQFAGPGFLLWDGGAYYPISDESPASETPPAGQAPQQEPPQQQPQLVVVQAPNAQQAANNSSAEEQIPDVGQFTLVLRNGSKLQAVAFTHVDNRIVYITTDGNKRSIAVADLNAEATIRANEERGTPLQLPL